MPEWLSIFLPPDLWESLTGPLWLTGNALFWSLALHALLSIPIAFWLARRQNVLTKLVGFVTTLPLIFPPIALGCFSGRTGGSAAGLRRSGGSGCSSRRKR